MDAFVFHMLLQSVGEVTSVLRAVCDHFVHKPSNSSVMIVIHFDTIVEL
jgi:hypothetical protein